MIKFNLLLLILICLTLAQENAIVNTPPYLLIPEVFNAARQEMSLTTDDLRLSSSIPLYGYYPGPDLYAEYNVAGFKAGSGVLSFYGIDKYSHEANKWEHQMNKSFYEKTLGNVSVDAGAGYDYDKKSSSGYEIDCFFSDTYNNTFTLRDVRYNTWYGNLNIFQKTNNASAVIAGFDCSKTRLSGYSFVDQDLYYYGRFASDHERVISYKKYTNSDYFYKHNTGIGLFNEFTTAHNQKRVSLLYTLWEYRNDHIALWYGDEISSYVNDNIPETITYQAYDDRYNNVSLNYLVLDKMADSIETVRPELLRIHCVHYSLEFLKISLMYSESSHIAQYFLRHNDSQSSGFYRPPSTYSSKSLYLSLESLTKIFIQQHFYINLYASYAYYPPISEDYNLINFSINPGIGAKFSILETFLCDLTISSGIIEMLTDLVDNISLSFPVPSINLRIAILK